VSAVLEVREPSARYLEAGEPALVRQFQLLATAQGGVARLRELILTLAVRGKVVPQDLRDEPASELLGRIRSEREAHAAAGLIKHAKPVIPISAEEEPCALPRGWAWVRFGDLIHELCTGPFGSLIHKEDYVSGGVPLVNPSHMINGRIEHESDVSVSASMASQLTAYQLAVGDVLLARRGEMGRYALVTEREAGWLCGTGSFFLKLFKAYDRRFFGLTLEDPRLRRHLLGESVGATMTNLNQRILLDAVVAVAPLAEQARIVARVDELMRLCDALEAKGRLEAEQHGRLLGTLLGTLTDSRTPEELAANWQRVSNHFDLLLDRPEAVDALEQTIRDLAVRGLLVPQDPKDEPASALVDAIRKEKSIWILERKGKREAPESRNDRLSIPFAAPPGWSWVGPDQIALQITDGTHHTPKYLPSGVAFISVKDIDGSTVSFADCKYISEEEHRAINLRCNPERGDMLLCRIGTLGRPTLVDTDRPFSLFVSVGLLKLPKSQDIRGYLHLVLSSPLLADQYQSIKAGGSHTNKLNLGDIPRLQIPLPPLAEQARIVARVAELRRLCADLRQRLAASQTTQSHLADALVDLAVA
jgi:type I restriction enzyme S subunit